MARKAAGPAIVTTETALIEVGRKHNRLVVPVDSKHTTQDSVSATREPGTRYRCRTHLHLHRVWTRLPAGTRTLRV